VNTIVCQLDEATLKCEEAPADRLVYSKYFKPLVLRETVRVKGEGSRGKKSAATGEPDPTDIKQLEGLLRSELGFLFLDRTRIRPKGFAVGEHVYTLSLGPGEEVVIEQKTFSKRETTFEDQTEQEKQIDLELSSTLSTELAEGLDREKSQNEQTTFSAGGSAGGNIKGVDVKADASYSHSVEDASSQARKRSVKDSSTATSKVASRYRAMHKTTFRVATEDRFELTSKRVVKNPNQHTPIDLHYFKIQRRLELTQERYGARLCWAPVASDPAADIVKRIELGRKQIIDRALAQVSVPDRPPEVKKPDKPARVESSAVTEADKWGVTGDMSANYDLRIAIPADYVWNGDTSEVATLTQVWGRPSDNMGWNIEGTPVVDEAAKELVVTVHVGCRSWLGGPKVFMQAKARFIPDPNKQDAQYREDYQKWQDAVARWEAEVAAALQGPRAKADAEADAWERDMLAALNPVTELMDRIAKTAFPEAVRDEAWEVAFWDEIFDWENAGVTLYPGWWAARQSRDPLKGAGDFLNASWAKLYLPVRPGHERLALRWIIGRVRGTQLDAATEQRFTDIADELAAFRKKSFGDEQEIKLGGDDKYDEQYLTLARWSDLLPTDGTHTEVVQAMTNAADDLTRSGATETQRIAAARAAGEEQDVELKKKAVARVGANKPANVEIRIATEETSNGSGA
jgi:hypothetical protein